MATTQRDQDISERLLAHAEREYANGDITQAIEKAWHAVALCAAGISDARGWPNTSEEEARDNVQRLLVQSSDADDNRIRFMALESLHINYFDAIWNDLEAQVAIRCAKSLIEVFYSVDSQMPR